MPAATDNVAFLHNLYHKGPFAGHGFLCPPPCTPLADRGDYTVSTRSIAEYVPAITAHYATQAQWQSELGDHAVPLAQLGTGTQLYAAAFGCPVHEYEDSNPAARPLVKSATEADQVEEPDLWSCPGLMRVFELAEAVRGELGPEAYLGPPDLQTGFDTAALIWDKSDFYLALLMAPEAVHRLVAKCAGLLRKFLVELRREFPNMTPGHCPGGYVPPDLGWWASNDECGAFSTPVFEEFCLPEMIELSDTFGSFGMHCCADAEHQFESFKKIPNLYAFNRVPGRKGWDPLLEHFDGPDSPVHALGWVDAPRVKQFMAEADPATRFLFVNGAPTLDHAKAWLDQVRGA
ncbi:MAG: hypothetical protein WCP21_05895 [Armatimonadota bacterium]